VAVVASTATTRRVVRRATPAAETGVNGALIAPPAHKRRRGEWASTADQPGAATASTHVFKYFLIAVSMAFESGCCTV
jgi:hypothetical protein